MTVHASGLTTATDFAWTPDGDLLVTETDNARLVRHRLVGPEVISLGLDGATSVAVSDGRIFVSQPSAGNVTEVLPRADFPDADLEGTANYRDSAASSDSLAINLTGLTPPSAGRAYEGWLVNPAAGDKLSVGVLDLNSDGSVSHTYVDPDGTNLIAEYRTFAITVEPINDPDPATPGQVYWADSYSARRLPARRPPGCESRLQPRRRWHPPRLGVGARSSAPIRESRSPGRELRRTSRRTCKALSTSCKARAVPTSTQASRTPATGMGRSTTLKPPCCTAASPRQRPRTQTIVKSRTAELAIDRWSHPRGDGERREVGAQCRRRH